MKKTLLFLIVIALSTITQAQNNITVFSEDGETFVLHVNGEQINDEPTNRARATGILNGMASVRVVFSDNMIPVLKKNISFMESNTEVMGKLTLTKKGYKLRYYGESAILPDAISQEEPHLSQPDPELVNGTHIENTTIENTTIATETVQTTTQIAKDKGNESVIMKVKVPGFELDVDLSVPDLDMDHDTEITTTKVTKTTFEEADDGVVYFDKVITPVPYEGPSITDPCSAITYDIAPIKAAIKDEAFADDKMLVAKQGLKGKCVKVEGVKELAEVFSFEDDKLEFIKYAYEFTFDTDNYYQLNSVFSFSSSKEDLAAFLEGK